MKETLGAAGFGWQDGYAAFTVSKSIVPDVEAYIRNQREHHRMKTFEQEHRTLLGKHEIQYDERFLPEQFRVKDRGHVLVRWSDVVSNSVRVSVWRYRLSGWAHAPPTEH